MGAKFLVITGPSGAGKSTVIHHLLKIPLFELSVSYTTRNPRPEEKQGREYFFVTREEFEKKKNEGFFIEYTEFNGNYYGTPSSALEDDRIMILDIELDGLRFFKERNPRCFFCLVKINRESMERRLFARMRLENEEDQINEQEFKRRMETFQRFEGIEEYVEFNMIIDNSGSVESVVNQSRLLADTVIEYYRFE